MMLPARNSTCLRSDCADFARAIASDETSRASTLSANPARRRVNVPAPQPISSTRRYRGLSSIAIRRAYLSCSQLEVSSSQGSPRAQRSLKKDCALRETCSRSAIVSSNRVSWLCRRMKSPRLGLEHFATILPPVDPYGYTSGKAVLDHRSAPLSMTREQFQSSNEQSLIPRPSITARTRGLHKTLS